MIAHFSLPTREPRRTAELFAKLIDGVVLPFPVVKDAFVAIARDGSGVGIECLPEASAHHPGQGLPDPAAAAQGPQVTPWEVQIRADGVAGRQAVGFHAAITSPLDKDAIIGLAAAEGWRAVHCERGGVFDLVEVWIDNRHLVEVLPPEGTRRYLQFYNPDTAAQMFGAVEPA